MKQKHNTQKEVQTSLLNLVVQFSRLHNIYKPPQKEKEAHTMILHRQSCCSVPAAFL